MSKDLFRKHRALVQDYNAFYQREQQEPDYKETVTFAVGDFLDEQDRAAQITIITAYAHILKNTATREDVQIVKKYFLDAKKAHRRAAGLKEAAGK